MPKKLRNKKKEKHLAQDALRKRLKKKLLQKLPKLKLMLKKRKISHVKHVQN